MTRRLLVCTISSLSLISCSDTELIEARVAELNGRIDKLALTEEELSVKSKTVSDLELEVTKLEEARNYRVKNLVSRESIARRRIAALEGEMANMGARIDHMEANLEKYASTSGEAQKRVEELTRELEQVVDLGASGERGDEKVDLLERLIKLINALEEENSELRSALQKKL